MTKKQNRSRLQTLTVYLFSEEKERGEKGKKEGWRRGMAIPPVSEQKLTLVFIMVEAGGNTDQVRGAGKSFSAGVRAPCVSSEERYGWPGRHCVGLLSGQWGHQSWRTHLVSEGRLCHNLLLNHSEDTGLLILSFFLSLPLSSFSSVPICSLSPSFIFWYVFLGFSASLPLPRSFHLFLSLSLFLKQTLNPSRFFSALSVEWNPL